MAENDDSKSGDENPDPLSIRLSGRAEAPMNADEVIAQEAAGQLCQALVNEVGLAFAALVWRSKRGAWGVGLGVNMDTSQMSAERMTIARANIAAELRAAASELEQLAVTVLEGSAHHEEIEDMRKAKPE